MNFGYILYRSLETSFCVLLSRDLLLCLIPLPQPHVLSLGNRELFVIDGIIITHVDKVLGLNLCW